VEEVEEEGRWDGGASLITNLWWTAPGTSPRLLRRKREMVEREELGRVSLGLRLVRLVLVLSGAGFRWRARFHASLRRLLRSCSLAHDRTTARDRRRPARLACFSELRCFGVSISAVVVADHVVGGEEERID
jgi:hypothetical protein